VDVPAPAAGSAADRASGARSDPAARAREQSLGLCPDRWRVAQAWDHGFGDAGAERARPCQPLADTGARRLQLAIVPAPTGNTILACELFTVDTVRLRRLYVLFFVSIGARRGEFVACSSKPHTARMTQQARNLLMDLDDHSQRPRFLIHDRDTKFSHGFDAIFRTEGIRVIDPHTAPGAERQRTRRTLGANAPSGLPRPDLHPRTPPPRARPPGLSPALQRAQAAPRAPPSTTESRDPVLPNAAAADIRRRGLLGGFIHEYEVPEFANPKPATSGTGAGCVTR
jgi:hypothetical protein